MSHKAPDIFLSYSRDDQVTARRFAEAFGREGMDVWWDQSLNAGEAYDQVTESALKSARAVVVLWSKKSVDSRWVRTEATIAHRKGTLVPVMIEPCERPIMFELTQTSDLSHRKGDPKDEAWLAYVSSVRRFVEREAVGDTPAAAKPLVPAPRRFGPAVAAMVVAALVMAGAGLWLLTHNGVRTVQTQAAGRASGGKPVVTAVDASVAVLPFRDMSAAKDQDSFADGLTEEILNSLSRIPDLKVTARTSSFAFKGKDADMRTIGEALDVNNILEGSVRKDGGQLRVTAQLINAVSGYHLWSKTYERPFEEIFKIQDDIALSVAQALEISLGVGELGAQPGMTRNVEAYESYLGGIAAMPASPIGGSVSGATLVDGLTRAIGNLRRAVEIDPEFATAWSALGYAYGNLGLVTNSPPSPEVNLALENVRRLAPDSPETSIALAAPSFFLGDWNTSAAYIAKARAAAMQGGVPGRVVAQIDSAEANLFAGVGRIKESIIVREQARSRDPLNVELSRNLVTGYANAGDFTSAKAEMARGLRLEGTDPPSWVSTEYNLALISKDRASLPGLVDRLRGPFPDSALSAAMKPLLDKPALALAELRRRTAGDVGVLTLVTAVTWAEYFGEPEFAVELMERAYGPTFKGIVANGLMGAHMRDARQLPAFKALVRKVGLFDYWREFGWADGCHAVGTDDFECS